ncbi:hypothetical protein CEXT_188841 [Caerostris extrusa]|uniref:Uncharacterized protein n=1 Tax=Caerostris extrusa TaxID=172846 RepID=A0AAV4NMW1_CAEEX|nr:hypothetical protein CEXT_188841 [Caerostris extrusa]
MTPNRTNSTPPDSFGPQSTLRPTPYPYSAERMQPRLFTPSAFPVRPLFPPRDAIGPGFPRCKNVLTLTMEPVVVVVAGLVVVVGRTT